MAVIANHRAPEWVLAGDAKGVDHPATVIAMVASPFALSAAAGVALTVTDSVLVALTVVSVLLATLAGVGRRYYTTFPSAGSDLAVRLLLVRKRAVREGHPTVVRLIDEHLVDLREKSAALLDAKRLTHDVRQAIGHWAWRHVEATSPSTSLVDAAAAVSGSLPAGSDPTYVIRAHRALVAAQEAFNAASTEAVLLQRSAEETIIDGRRLRAAARLESSDRLNALEVTIAGLQSDQGRATQADLYHAKLRELAS